MHMRGLGNAWVGELTRQATEESRHARPGANGVITRLAELMFIEVLRRHLEELPSTQTGWLAALRDEVVGRALALLHAGPGQRWTLDELARGAATSRSNLAKRFTDLVGQPPMQYLLQWRMQVRDRHLASALPASVSDSEKPATFLHPSKQWPSGSRKRNGRWRQAYSTPALTSAPYLRR
jgi:AraC-like DNA-binding protein